MEIRGLNRLSFALGSLVVGSVALLLFSIFHLWWITIPLCIAGLVLAGFELRTPLDEAQERLWLIIAAPIVCLIGLLVATIVPLFWGENTTKVTANATEAALTIPQSIPFPFGKQLTRVPVEPDPPKQAVETDEAGNPVEPVEETGAPADQVEQQPEQTEQQTEQQNVQSSATEQQPATEPPPEPKWVDASSSAAEVGEVAVGVVSAKVQQLEVETGGKTSQSPDYNLVIHLQVVLTDTSGKVEYVGWGGSSFGDAKFKPTITDNSGKTYPVRVFGKGTTVVGQARSTSLYPKLFADDFLVFEEPAAEIDFLRLELPAAAFGGAGTIRFEIPKALIEIPPEKKAPKGMRFRPKNAPALP